MSFKIGQEVVFTGVCRNSVMIYPKPFDEVLIITGFEEVNNTPHAFIQGYEIAKNGNRQAFSLRHLIPLDSWQQAEYMVRELVEGDLVNG